jgi:hypothetical protein
MTTRERELFEKAVAARIDFDRADSPAAQTRAERDDRRAAFDLFSHAWCAYRDARGASEKDTRTGYLYGALCREARRRASR